MLTARVSVPGPYKRLDMVNSWNANRNTMSHPPNRAGRSRGTMTVRPAVNGPAPDVRAAQVNSGGK